MSRTSDLREDLLDEGATYSLGAQAYVFCEMFVKAAKGMKLDESEALLNVMDAISRKRISFEDRTLLKPPPPAEAKIFNRYVVAQLDNFSRIPTYETLIVLRDCIVEMAKRGVPPELIEALIRSFWNNLDLVVLRLKGKGEDGGGGGDFNGLPSWIRPRHEA